MDLEPYIKQITEGAPDFDISKCKSIIPVQDGWSSLVLDVDAALQGEYIFRFPRFPEIRAGHEKEAALLPVLANALPVAVPRFEYVWLDDASLHDPFNDSLSARPTRGFVAYRKLPGVPLDQALLRQPAIIQALAQFLSALHAFPASQAAVLKVPGGNASDWRKMQLDFYTWIQEQLFPLLDKRQRFRARDTWEPFLENVTNFQFHPVLIHADLAAEHILCDPQAGNITGLIDWEDAALGDPALDFAGLLSLGDLESVRAVIGAYQGELDNSLESRAAWYLALAPYHQARYGLLFGLPSHLEQGLHLI
jgi:aminoglycoside 2''-phosphotransferase